MKCAACGSDLPSATASCLQCGTSVGGLAAIPPPIAPGAPADAGFSFPPGTVVAGRFTLKERLGRGRMSVVYLAEDNRTRQPVALKLMTLRNPVGNLSATAFLHEAEVLSLLNHPGILRVYDVGQWTLTYYMAVELAENGVLRDTLARVGRMPVEEACDLMRQVGEAIAYAHSAGVIHRDLRPETVFLNRLGFPKLGGFKFAKMRGKADPVPSGMAVGSPGYVSPEQAQAPGFVDPRTDIYSFGALFYKLVTGLDPSQWDPQQIPRPVDALIQRCLRERDARYQTMEEALVALGEARRGSGAVLPVTPLGMASPIPVPGVCPKCAMANSPQARYCKRCGQSLVDRCPRCGREGQAPILFCESCGVDVRRYSKYQEHLNTGRRLAETGNYHGAEAQLTSAVALFPEEPEPKNLLARVRARIHSITQLKMRLDEGLKKGDLQSAVAAAQEVLKIAPQDSETRHLAIEAAAKLARIESEKLVSLAHEAIANRELSKALELLSQAHEKNADHGEAAELLKQVSERKAKLEERLEAGRRAMRMRDFEKARAAAQEVLNEWLSPEAEQLERDAELAMRERTRRMNAGKKAFEEGRLKEAIQVWEEARRIRGAPELDELISRAKSRLKRRKVIRITLAVLAALFASGGAAAWLIQEDLGRMETGEEYLKQGKYREAKEEFARVWTPAVDTARARALATLCGEILRAQEEEGKKAWDKALEAWDRAVKLAKAREVAGMEPLREAFVARRRKAFEEALGRSRKFHEERRWKDALEALDEARRILPEGEGAAEFRKRVEEDWYRDAFARAEERLKDESWKEAEAANAEALQVRPGDAAATEQKDRIARARAAAERFREILARADRLRGEKRWPQALEAVEEALQVRREDAAAVQKKQAIREEWRKDAIARALAHEQRREWAQARAAADEALKLNAADAEAEAIRRRVVEADREGSYRAALSQAEAALAAKQWDEARAAVKRALELREGDSRAKNLEQEIGEKQFEDALARAAKHIEKKEWDLAEQAADEALKLRPDHPEATAVSARVKKDRVYWKHCTGAEAHLRNFELEKARGEAKKAREEKAGAEAEGILRFLEALERGFEARNRGDWARAAPCAQEALQLRPGEPAGLWLAGEVKDKRRRIALNPARDVVAEFVYIPPDKFQMGETSADRGSDEEPHRVTITKGFWMQTTETTQRQWETLMKSNPSQNRGDPNRPVDSVNWDDCQRYLEAFAAACAEQLGGGRPDLPTEAEWEFACRASASTRFCFGDDAAELPKYAWFNERDQKEVTTYPVAQKQPNKWGLYDMHGNVWELCKDWYVEKLTHAVDPLGASGKLRVVRGGSVANSWRFLRCANRLAVAPTERGRQTGFRPVIR